MEDRRKSAKHRSMLQWMLAPLVVITVALGWKYPMLGFSVPVAMGMGMIGGFINGRYVCGNLCPRGAFYDRLVAPLSPKRNIPSFLRKIPLRLCIFAAMIGLMIFKISKNPASIEHWGHVFWFMCTVTTIIGLFLAFTFHYRSWCAFCPIGTFQNLVGGHKNQLSINEETCAECGLCAKKCPMKLNIITISENGLLKDRDCLKCAECINSCPRNSLSFGEKTDPDFHQEQ